MSQIFNSNLTKFVENPDPACVCSKRPPNPL